MADDEPPEEFRAITALVGTVLGERYALERVLGTGGMGAVFEGKDLRLGRPVAVKVMQPGYARDAEYGKRFLREAQACSLIRHRNVVVILDYGKSDDGLVYSVMELLVGQDLEALLRGRPEQRLPWAQACELLVQIASGLKAAHGRGVIHRDIKPANCFLTMEDDESVVKVVDFGIAKLGEGAQTQQLTATGNVLGTPSYTAPEMVLTGGPASPRSDVYSLGVLAYRMLTGRLPFTGKTGFEVMHHACILPVPPMRGPGVELPEGVEALVLEMLSKTPGQRPADMGEVRRRLLVLGREAGAVLEGVEAAASSLRIEVGGAGVSGAREVVRTDVPTAPVPRAGAELAPADRTEVMAGAGFREPTGRPVVTPVVVAAAERTEVLDSGQVVRERPPRKSAGWLVGGGLAVAAVSGVVAWVMIQGGEPATVRKDEGGAGVVVEAKTEAEPRAMEEPPTKLTEAPKVVTPVPVEDAKTVVVPVTVEPEPEKVEPKPVVEAEPEPTKPVVKPQPTKPVVKPQPTKPQPSKAPVGPPSDAALKKKLAREIKANCGVALAGKGVTVVFDVTTHGEVKRLTAMPKGPAGDCAKRQVDGVAFRTRDDETNIEIEVK